MVDYILSQINALSNNARETYGVNPVIFIVIYFICVPIFYYSLIRTLRAVARKLGNEILLWSAIFLGATVAPFLYVLLFGRNIPWWVYGIIFVLIGQGVLSLILKLKKKPAGDS